MNIKATKLIVDREKIKNFYKNYIAVTGTTIGWSSPQVAEKAYQAITNLSEQNWSKINNILDVGCGEGHLFRYLREKKGYEQKYTGIEVVPFCYEKAIKFYG